MARRQIPLFYWSLALVVMSSCELLLRNSSSVVSVVNGLSPPILGTVSNVTTLGMNTAWTTSLNFNLTGASSSSCADSVTTGFSTSANVGTSALLVSGTAPNCLITIAVSAGVSGSAILTLKATNSAGSSTSSFTFTVISPPATAFSIRQVALGYTGKALKVRRSSDNATLDVGFNSDGTLNKTTLLSFVGSGNGYVTTWYDQSGGGYDATQATQNYQPQIVNNGTFQTNGLYFFGSSTKTYMSSPFTLSQLTSTNKATFNVVVTPGASNIAYGGVLDFRTATNYVTGIILDGSIEFGMDWWNDALYSWTTGAVFTVGNSYTLTVINQGTQQNLYLGNSKFTNNSTSSTIPSGTSTTLSIGYDPEPSVARYFIGNIAEALLWGFSISTSEQTTLKSWQNSAFTPGL